ncbi:hypothetical protein SERLA73DRAFT_182634, partial [Serpula lacrymans var. lacrymans S7.3]
ALLPTSQLHNSSEPQTRNYSVHVYSRRTYAIREGDTEKRCQTSTDYAELEETTPRRYIFICYQIANSQQVLSQIVAFPSSSRVGPSLFSHSSYDGFRVNKTRNT